MSILKYVVLSLLLGAALGLAPRAVAGGFTETASGGQFTFQTYGQEDGLESMG